MEHISIHALREEGDGAPHPAGARTQHFYPRPPRGGRRSRNSSFGKSKVFLSTPSARRATTRGLRRSCRGPISIHALREEGDPRRKSRSNLWSIFLSTPSVRRATPSRHFLLRADAYFYPRPPRGGRQPGLAGRKDISYFYPRPPRGGRRLWSTDTVGRVRFLSTPSARRATLRPSDRRGAPDISIHALREEGDRPSRPSPHSHRHFYPRPPRGGRLPGRQLHQLSSRISIHALREEGDTGPPKQVKITVQFLSTPSARRATLQCLVTWSSHRYFYPRPPRGGRPSAAGQHAEPDRFLSTPSARRATPRPQKWPWYKKFLSTPSARRATVYGLLANGFTEK